MLFDVNVSLGHWPFMRFEQNSAEKLSCHLEAEGVGRALVSAIDAALYPDPHVCNLELARAVEPHANLTPLMTVDPTLTHWRDCLDAYRRQGLLNAVRLLPNYHRYGLAAPCVNELAQAVSEASGVLVVQMRLEDERNQYPLMKVRGVPVWSVTSLAQRHPELTILCLCPYLPEAAELVRESKSVFVDTSFIELVDTLAEPLKRVPPSRVLFGSHTPFLYTRANIMKVQCASISDAEKESVAHENAERLFGMRGADA